jgi:hypothetical protein
MKKMLLTAISMLIIVLSSVLIYHVATEEPVDVDQTIDGDDNALSDFSSEIDYVLLDEDNEIEIGEMI